MAVRSKYSAFSSATTVNGGGIQKPRAKISEKEKKRYQALVQKAKTLSEVQKLEKAFAEGRLPAGVADEDAMDET